jgi:hypothetical protein
MPHFAAQAIDTDIHRGYFVASVRVARRHTGRAPLTRGAASKFDPREAERVQKGAESS